MLQGDTAIQALPAPQASEPVIMSEAEVENAARKNLVKSLQKEIVFARDVYFRNDYKQMIEDMQFAYDGADPEWIQYGGYVANIVQRHIHQKTSSLYAKNPKAAAKTVQRMDFEIWNEDPQTLMQAFQLLQSGVRDMNSIMLLQDYQRGMTERAVRERVAKTLELVYHHFQNEQTPMFKQNMKQMVRRAVTTCVGYVKLGYQREVGKSPDTVRALADNQRKIATIEGILKESRDNSGFEIDDKNLEKLRLLQKSLMNAPEVVLREGPVWAFPLSTMIIPDPKCTVLTGFVGGDWVAEEYQFTANEIREIWDVDVTGKAKAHTYRGETNSYYRGIMGANGERLRKRSENSEAVYRVWEMHHWKDGMVYYICEDHPDFLEEPDAPKIPLETGHPYFTFVPNQHENSDKLFPKSDVGLIRDQQRELNRQREGLRSHRIANKPKYIAPKGWLTDTDKEALRNHEESAIIELSQFKPGQDSAAIVQPFKTSGIDPNLYDVSQSFDDILRVVGSQEANLGGMSGGTATESSIAESSRIAATTSNQDDLDMTLTQLARSTGQVLMAMLSLDRVREIAGRGASWPQFTRDELMKEVYLTIEAGSTGKPNQALAIQNFKEMMPTLIQMPNLNIVRLNKEAIRRLDENLDVNEFIMLGAPSVVAINNMLGKVGSSMMGGGMGADGSANTDPAATDPNAPQMATGAPMPMA